MVVRSIINGTIVVENKDMRKTISIICFVLAAITMWADEQEGTMRPNLLDSMPGVEVKQDSSVYVLLRTAIYGQQQLVEIDGYRVQIYSSNQQQTAKAEALELETKLKDKISQTLYVQYLPPFWKVRLGDFRDYEDAKEYKRLFVQQYPEMQGDTYVVRDKIMVMQ